MKTTFPTTPSNTSLFLEVAVRAAQEAGALQVLQIHNQHQIEFKGDINLVTEVDKASEALIMRELSSHFADHNFLGEEGGQRDNGSDYTWIFDPLDGTTNYAHGYPLFCVSIALEYKGEIILGVVYDPNRGELFWAEKGQGSFLNGKPLRVTTTNQIDHSLLATGFSYNVKEVQDNNLNHFCDMIMAARAVRRDGVAAIDLCYVACGRYDGFWELNLMPWDVAAGKLILEEAGGQVTRFSLKPFSIRDTDILATNGLIHQGMSEILIHPKSKVLWG